MVLQYKLKPEKRWKKYPGKEKMKVPFSKCDFRLLTSDKSKLIVQGSYSKVLKRFRQVEFFKRRG